MIKWILLNITNIIYINTTIYIYVPAIYFSVFQMILVTYSNVLVFKCFRTYQINPHKDTRIKGETRKYGDFNPLETEQSRAWECTQSYNGRTHCITDGWNWNCRIICMWSYESRRSNFYDSRRSNVISCLYLCLCG